MSHARPTRRRVLAAAAIAPLLTAGLGVAEVRGEPSALVPDGTPQPSTLPDLRGISPLPLSGQRRATFEAFIAATLAESQVPGAAVAVVQNGEVDFLQGFGVRQLGQPAPVTADTLLRIGSVTKSFSSLLAATLVDAGRLDWTTPLVELLPAFAVANPELTPRLTVRDAFCACTGLPRRDLEFMLNAQTLTPEQMLDGMARLPLTTPFGETFQYNNQMVAAGGFAAAVAGGGSPTDLGHAYAIALRERVLNPIGMSRSTLALTDVVRDNDYATPHAADIAGALHSLPLLEDDQWLLPVAPAGALWSSAREMARYLQTELASGLSPDRKRVVSTENLKQTWQPAITFPAAPEAPPALATSIGYGLGWGIGAYGGQRLINHSGATLGFSSLVTFLPDADLGLVILTNGTGVAPRFNNAVQMYLLELLFDQPETAHARLTSFLTEAAQQRTGLLDHLGQVDPATTAPFLGNYTNADLGDLTLTMRSGSLLMTVGGFRSALRPYDAPDAPAATYLPVDAPFCEGGISPTPMSIELRTGSSGQPQVLLSILDDYGAELVYPYEKTG